MYIEKSIHAKSLSYGRGACLIALPKKTKKKLKAPIMTVHECQRCPCSAEKAFSVLLDVLAEKEALPPMQTKF